MINSQFARGGQAGQVDIEGSVSPRDRGGRSYESECMIVPRVEILTAIVESDAIRYSDRIAQLRLFLSIGRGSWIY